MTDFEKQISFIMELDKIKKITRQTYLSDGSRKENDAEHSWHLALMAFVLEIFFILSSSMINEICFSKSVI